MNHYEHFNDPFECWCNIITGFPSINEKSERLRALMKAWGFDDINDKYAQENYDAYVESLLNLEPDVPDLINSARITCFSKRPNNLLMWSHYANGLRGFCLEFDPSLILFNYQNFAKIYEVKYKEHPAEIDTALIAVLMDQINYNSYALDSATSDDLQKCYKHGLNKSIDHSNEIFEKMLATKPLDWMYEEELRIIFQSSYEKHQGQFLNYPQQAIKSVIFGEKMPEKEKNALRVLFELHSYPIEFKLAKREKRSFNVVVENYI